MHLFEKSALSFPKLLLWRSLRLNAMFGEKKPTWNYFYNPQIVVWNIFGQSVPDLWIIWPILLVCRTPLSQLSKGIKGIDLYHSSQFTPVNSALGLIIILSCLCYENSDIWGWSWMLSDQVCGRKVTSLITQKQSPSVTQLSFTTNYEVI